MDGSQGLAAVQCSAWMTDVKKDVSLSITGRHRDVQIGVHGKDHGDIWLTVSPRESRRERYDGPYSLASLADEMQILDTENKIMRENLIVLPIPYYETSNPKGGLTVYIGGD